MRHLLHILLFSTFCSYAAAEVPGCPDAEAKSSQLRSWADVYGYFKRYNGWCIDGALGEGVSESITRLLDNSWSSFMDFQKLSEKDARFSQWVAMRFGGYPEDECAILRALDNLENACPKGARQLCHVLASRGCEHTNPELYRYCAPNPSLNRTCAKNSAGRSAPR